MGHLRRLGGRWSALGGAWPDPKGPGRCLPTPWVPWVRAVPIGPLRWPGGRSRGPESAVLPSGAVVGTHPVRPCTCTMRPTQVPELPLAGPHAPRGPTRSLGWARGGCFGLEGACGACFRSPRQIPLFSRACGPWLCNEAGSPRARPECKLLISACRRGVLLIQQAPQQAHGASARLLWLPR